MRKMNRFERVNKLLTQMKTVQSPMQIILHALIDSMSEDEVHDKLDFIVIMYDIEEEE